MTLIESSTSLLEKYANLHTAMEDARTEAAQCRSEMQLCQGQIQDLLEHRQRMQEATHQACQEQEILQQELDQHGRELESLQKEHDQVMRMRYDHAQHVQSMIQRRQETTRKDYEQSLQYFQTACQQFIQGNIQQPPPPPPPPPVPTSSTTRRDDKAPPSSNSVSQQNPSHHDKEKHPNNHNDSTLNGTSPSPSRPNTNIMKIDWKGLFSQILSTTNDQTLHHVLQELVVPDSEQQTTTDPSDQESPLTLNMDQSLTEQEAVTTVIPDQKTTGRREGQSNDSVVVPDAQDTNHNKQVLSTSSLSSFLFSQCLQVIDKLQLIKTKMADEAQAKLVALQAQYNQALQDHDHVHKDHAQWLTKITRQRSQKEQLSRQLDRLHNDVKRLHQQIDQVHSQTLELQQQQQYHESQTGSKRQKTRLSSHNHDQDTFKVHSEWKVRNPYLQSTKTNKPKRSLHESHDESFLTTTHVAEKENDYPTYHHHHQQQQHHHHHHHHQSKNKSASSSLHQERQADHSSSSRRAMISPLAETSIHPTLTSATTSSSKTRASMATDTSQERVPDSSTIAARHHHRSLGRVRGARDFGVSLSLESTSHDISTSIVNTTEDYVNRSRACLMATHHNMDEMVSFPVQQKPTTSSSNRMTPLVESTTRNTGSTTGNEPAVVSVAKSRDSTTTRLLHRRLHHHHDDDSSSHDDDDGDHDSCLSQESIPPRHTGCEHDDDHDNDDPVFHFVFRKE